jgi:hypothetical protein
MQLHNEPSSAPPMLTQEEQNRLEALRKKGMRNLSDFEISEFQTLAQKSFNRLRYRKKGLYV